jgi:hypothetical protein
LGAVRQAALAPCRHNALGSESYRLRIGRNERPATATGIVRLR